MAERVQKIIANSGFCSRRNAEELIISGKVKVNGQKITIGDKADPNKDTISIGDHLIKPDKQVYFALNKPIGYITTSKDMYDRKKVIDLINVNERIFPVGRLDRDAGGLIFLTNDGNWSNRIVHPRYKVGKTYLVELDSPFDKTNREIIEKGIRLSDGLVKGKIKILEKKKIEIKIHVGKNKIVKRIFNHFGHRVVRLTRIKIGDINLGKLKPTQYRSLTKEEIKSFL